MDLRALEIYLFWLCWILIVRLEVQTSSHRKTLGPAALRPFIRSLL